MTEITLCARRLGQPDVHEYFGRKFPLPEYYGNNLDALFDVLTSLSETTVKVRGTAKNEQAEQVLQVLRDAAEENENLTLIEK